MQTPPRPLLGPYTASPLPRHGRYGLVFRCYAGSVLERGVIAGGEPTARTAYVEQLGCAVAPADGLDVRLVRLAHLVLPSMYLSGVTVPLAGYTHGYEDARAWLLNCNVTLSERL